MMAFSLFGERQHLRHIEDEQQAAEELFALLSDARDVYLRDVVIGGKIYRRFAEDFVNSHRYIECSRTVCRNCHEMNIHIVKGLLYDCHDLIIFHFTAASFTFEACVELKRVYDTGDSAIPNITRSQNRSIAPLSFGCAFSKIQIEQIADCANRYALFCSEITADDMTALLSCQPDFHIKVYNIRRVAILFDALHERGFIRWNWQTVLAKGKFLLKKDGSRFLGTSSLSTAVSDTRGSDDAVAFGIRRVVAGLKK